MNLTGIIFLDRTIDDEILSRSYGVFFDEKLSHIKNHDYKCLSAGGAYLLEKMIDRPLNEVDFYIDEFGKPQVKEHQFHFNISHSENAVICAVSEYPVGVDIEYTGRQRSHLLNKCFTELELNCMQSNQDIYKYWTLKESYLKNLGTGIDRDLTEVEFDLSNTIICKDRGNLVNKSFSTHSISGYKIAVCSDISVEFSKILLF